MSKNYNNYKGNIIDEESTNFIINQIKKNNNEYLEDEKLAKLLQKEFDEKYKKENMEAIKPKNNVPKVIESKDKNAVLSEDSIFAFNLYMDINKKYIKINEEKNKKNNKYNDKNNNNDFNISTNDTEKNLENLNINDNINLESFNNNNNDNDDDDNNNNNESIKSSNSNKNNDSEINQIDENNKKSHSEEGNDSFEEIN